MSTWKQLLLNLYYATSLPSRRRRNEALCAAGKAPVMVLFYHRVADTEPNDWTTTNATFARQMHWLKRHFDMVSLSEAQRRIRSGHSDRACVSITFDDGYADNCSEAMPLLIRESIPCTYFVATDNVRRGVAFPHDAVRGRPLAPNTPAQVRDLAAAGIEIGAHTRTHPDLGCIPDRDRLVDELVGSRRELQLLTGRTIRFFAFPYGKHKNMSPAAFELARTAGYEGVCSAYGGYNFPGDDAFHLQRIHADDDMIRLKNWTTLDPRKLKSIKRYEYESALGGLLAQQSVAEQSGATA